MIQSSHRPLLAQADRPTVRGLSAPARALARPAATPVDDLALAGPGGQGREGTRLEASAHDLHNELGALSETLTYLGGRLAQVRRNVDSKPGDEGEKPIDTSASPAVQAVDCASRRVRRLREDVCAIIDSLEC